MGAAILPSLIGGGLGLVGSIIGSNSQQHAANQQAQAGQQASSAETQLINQGMLPILNQLTSEYNQNYAPLQGGASGEMQSLLYGNQLPELSNISNLASLNPSQRDQLTGIPLSGLTNNILNYDSNPQNTLSGLGGIGGDVLSGYMNGNTNLAGVMPGVASYFGNPGSTDLAQLTPGGINFFGNEAANGLSPTTIGSALNPLDVQTQQQINSIQNQLGNSTPNEAGLLSDLNLQGLQNKAGLLSSLAGQNQAFQNQGMQDMLGAGAGLDSQTAAMLGQLPTFANQLDQQTLQRLGLAMQTAGGIDQQTQSMLGNAYNVGQGAQGIGMGYMGSNLGAQQGLLSDVMNYLTGGNNLLTQSESGMQNIAGMYGQAAGQAGQNALTIGMNSSNPFSSLGSFFASNPNLFSGGNAAAASQQSNLNNYGSFFSDQSYMPSSFNV